MARLYSVGFYNVENLFDPYDDPETFDDDFTPYGSKQWTIKRYENKVGKIAKAISSIGKDKIGVAPSLLAMAEVENSAVMKDLLHVSHLRNLPLNFVHFDSKDERGIDVSLIYNYKDFKLDQAYPINPPEYLRDGELDFTRDILYVEGRLAEIKMHLFIVHLPSQRNHNINLEQRNQIAALIRYKSNEILLKDADAKIMILGDFNTNPADETLKKYFKTTAFYQNQEMGEFYNPTELMYKEGQFTNNHKRNSIFFDQMLFSKGFYTDHRTRLVSSHVFNPYFLQEWSKKYKGQPFRTFVGRKYLGGYSDHFPVYSILKI